MDLFKFNGLNQIKLKKSNMGIVYLGSKRKIAYDILKVINKECPNASTIYDLFGGGGAITLTALKSGYNVVYNEINHNIYSIFDYLKNPRPSKFGIFPEEFYYFVNRDKFNELQKEKSLYSSVITQCYGFGGLSSNYFCNKFNELQKEKGHNLVIFKDKTSADYYDDYFNHSFFKDFIKLPFKNWIESRNVFVNAMIKIESLHVTGLINKSPFKTMESIIKTKTRDICTYINNNMPADTKIKKYKEKRNNQRLERLEQLQRLQRLEQLQQLERLEQLEQLQQLQRLEQLERLERLEIYNLDYRDVKIPLSKENVIYCDIPYKNTRGYNIGFNHGEFYTWALDMAKKGHKIFISEYSMPSDFKKIWQKGDTINKANQIEKVFIVKD